MTDRAGNSTDVKPLTKRKKDTDEVYFRRPEVELQIGEVSNLSNQQILESLKNKDRVSKGYLIEETIVYLLREAKTADESQMIETLYTELNRRIWKLLSKFRTSFRNNQTDFEEFGQRVELIIIKKIFDIDSNSADYAQVNFGDFVISAAKGVWKQNLIQINREKIMFETGREDDENDNRLENILWEKELSAESRLIIEEGLKMLSPEHQTVAAMLLDGFQIESKNPDEPTISKHLGVSSRTIRNWIKEMRQTLTGYQGEARQ